MWPFKRKELNDVLNKTKSVVIQGVLFEIRKIDPMAYLDGSNVLKQLHNTYEEKIAQEKAEVSFTKLKKHYSDVFLAGVIKPKISRQEEDGAVQVDEIFRDWPMAHELYNQIQILTYGKKKA